MGKSWIKYVYVASLVLHAGVAAAVSAIQPEVERAPTAITIREVRPPKTPEAEPPPPPPPPPPQAAEPVKRARPRPAPAAEAPAPEPARRTAAAVPDFGVTLSGSGSAIGGIAVPQAQAADSEPETRTARRVLGAESDDGGCTEEASKPRPIQVPQPEYTTEAREASIEGRVRVQLTVDENGAVTNAQVLQPLGHGLDDAALEAVRRASFEAATRCGRAVEATFTISIRFTL